MTTEYHGIDEPNWDYRSVPPYQYAHIASDGRLLMYGNDDDLEHVVKSFLATAIPPRHGHTIYAIDAHKRLVIGYSWWEREGAVWYGVAEAYELLARLYTADPLAVVMWEASARRDLEDLEAGPR